MKIKMISCAVTNEHLVYNYGMTLTVGKEIDEAKAKDFVKNNLAILVEEPVQTPVESTEKPKKGRKKKGDSHEV